MRLIAYIDKERRFVDILMLCGGILGPVSTIPQILEIYSSKSAVSVSLLSWAMYLALSVVGIAYSIVHRNRTLLLGYGLYFIMDLAVVVGVLLYE